MASAAERLVIANSRACSAVDRPWLVARPRKVWFTGPNGFTTIQFASAS